jgi:hypothetical protein
MRRYLIEVPHEEDTVACAKVIKIFLSSGSHFLTNAEWGCGDGDHRCWMIVDVNDRNEALGIVPPGMRAQTRIVRLARFTMDEIDTILQQHVG